MKNEDITLDMLDPDSREFIEWSAEYLSDPIRYHELILEELRRAKNFFSHDPEEIKAKLLQKFIIGGYEHGSPSKYSWEQVYAEKELEYIDMPGWELVGKFAEWKRQQKKS